MLDDYAPKPKCTGLIFRGYSSMFITGNRIERREGLRFLKRKSCLCDACCSTLDTLDEEVHCGNLILPDIEHGALYALKYTNISRDYETGIVDDWNVEFIQVEEKADANNIPAA